MKIQTSLIKVVLFGFILLTIGCKASLNPVNHTIKKTPFNASLIDTSYLDTMIIFHETICFPEEQFCMDHHKFQFFKVSKGKGENKIFGMDDGAIIMEKDTTTNIYRVDLSTNNTSEIIQGFIDMLRTENKLLDLVNRRRNANTPVEYLDTMILKTDYFFNYSTINSVYLVDSIDYKFNKNSTMVNNIIIVKLELKIKGSENLNKIKINYEKLLNTDHVIHKFSSDDNYCKNIEFTLQYIIRDKNLYSGTYYLPEIWNLVNFKIKDE